MSDDEIIGLLETMSAILHSFDARLDKIEKAISTTQEQPESVSLCAYCGKPTNGKMDKFYGSHDIVWLEVCDECAK